MRWEKGYEKLIALQGVGHSATTINITNASWNNANTLHQTGQLRHSSLFRTCRRIREHRRILPSLQHSTPFIPCDQEENTNEEPSWTEKIKITSLQDERKSCDLRIYLLPLLICSTCVEYCYAFRHSQTSKQQRRPLEAFHRFMTSWSLLSLEIVLMPSINTNNQCKHILKHNLLIDLKTTSRGWLFFECLGSCSGCADAYLGHPCLRLMWLAEGSMFRQGVWCNVVSLVSTQNGLGIKQVKLRTYPCNNTTTIFTGVLWSFWVVLTGCFFMLVKQWSFFSGRGVGD